VCDVGWEVHIAGAMECEMCEADRKQFLQLEEEISQDQVSQIQWKVLHRFIKSISKMEVSDGRRKVINGLVEIVSKCKVSDVDGKIIQVIGIIEVDAENLCVVVGERFICKLPLELYSAANDGVPIGMALLVNESKGKQIFLLQGGQGVGNGMKQL